MLGSPKQFLVNKSFSLPFKVYTSIYLASFYQVRISQTYSGCGMGDAKNWHPPSFNTMKFESNCKLLLCLLPPFSPLPLRPTLNFIKCGFCNSWGRFRQKSSFWGKGKYFKKLVKTIILSD